MIPLDTSPAHDLPHWSPYAIACGFAIGFLWGTITVALYALQLRRLERSAGSGRTSFTHTAESSR